MGSGQVNVEAILRNHHTRWLVAGMCPECTVGHLIPCAEGRRRFGTIHCGGHSTANPVENRILRLPFLFSSTLCRVTILGVAKQTNMHLTASILTLLYGRCLLILNR
ncbi:hypothetical protein AVEN_80185-1 [Araneus ventricosus]|uniref:Uncharacterized protein n=1 Tax=Araneus ventricosus TaxID=182803 RepID=A0A4Y2FFL0_ARAVE|nr:hypothetical protein AVEN_80185-1 [Araneus ventricosus]